MPILSASKLTQIYGENDLFLDLDVRLDAKQRVGLVGANGSGKTTLLMILAGLVEPTSGSVVHSKALSLGYLRQEAVLTFRGQENSIYDEMLTVFADVIAIEEEMRALEARMEAGEYDEALLNRYSEQQTAFDVQGGFDFRSEIKLVLIGLGFSAETWQTPLSHLSGGQKTRVLLARLLLEQPDLLILDEPTNHLDMQAVEWLETMLRRWQGTLIVVSHDRYFLDRVVNTVWDLTTNKLHVYKGNYSKFVVQRQEKWEREEALFSAEKERLTKDLDWARRHIAGGKTDQAKGRLRLITRDIILLEKVGVLEMKGKSWAEIGGRVHPFAINEAEKRLRQLRFVTNRPPVLKIGLKSAERSDRVVLKGKRLKIGYGETPLFEVERLRIERFDRVALLGPNGSGKSTLIKSILGKIDPISGEVVLAKELKVGYFAQAHEQLNSQNSVLDELLTATPMSIERGRNFLSRYLFRGHDVFKKIADLSGGERGRLALAVLASQGANFLLLDEPTNHLDLPSQDMLQTALQQYDGTILMVSHDRYLIDKLATQIWEISGDRLDVFAMSYADYLEKKALAEEAARSGGATDAPPPDLSWVDEVFDEDNEDEPVKKPSNLTWREQAAELEDQLEETEAWVAELKSQIAEARLNNDDSFAVLLQAELVSAEKQLNNLLKKWDSLME